MRNEKGQLHSLLGLKMLKEDFRYLGTTWPTPLYKDGVGPFVKGHLFTHPNLFKEGETSFLERDSFRTFLYHSVSLLH